MTTIQQSVVETVKRTHELFKETPLDEYEKYQ
jgi:hypothetical protein